MTALLLLLLYLFAGTASGTTTTAGSGAAVVVAPTAGAQAQASLAITVWPRGLRGRSVRWTLRCAPAGGTLPRAADACRRLAALERPFAPVPGGTVCTAIFGGPQVARVRGRFRGNSVDARFNRRDGCEIGRWNRVRFLFPAR